MSSGEHVTTNRAVSTRDPDRVRIDDRDDMEFIVGTPDAAGAESFSPEQLYAAALSSCLHQAVMVEATRLGATTTTSRMRCAVSLTHTGNQRFGLRAELSVELPDVDTDTARQIRSEALANCPPVHGVEITTDADQR